MNTRMDIEQVKQDVLNTESQRLLFELMIDITKEISTLHIELTKTEDKLKKIEIKGKINLLSTFLNIINNRIEEVKMIEKKKEQIEVKNERKELMSNRQFRIAAQTVLTKETYERIVELSLNYHKFKEQRNDLKANKIE